MGAGTGLDVRKKVEEAERKFHERVLHHHIVDDEYFVLTSDNDQYNESVDEYSFYEQLNGRDRNPDAVQDEMHDLLKPIADDEMRRTVVDARAACASEQEQKGLQRRVSDSVFVCGMVTMCSCQVTGVLFPGFMLLLCWLHVLPGGGL